MLFKKIFNLSTNKFIKLNNFNPYNIWSSGSGISFAMWIKMDNLSSYVYANRNQRIFSIASVSNSGDTTSPNRNHQFGIWRTQYEPTRTLTFYYSGSSVNSYTTSAFLTDSTWHHIVWSINSSGNWAIFIDGLDQNVNITLSLIISGIPPTFEAIIHAPLLIASAATKPKGSSHIEGITTIEALFIFSSTNS